MDVLSPFISVCEILLESVNSVRKVITSIYRLREAMVIRTKSYCNCIVVFYDVQTIDPRTSPHATLCVRVRRVGWTWHTNQHYITLKYYKCPK